MAADERDILMWRGSIRERLPVLKRLLAGANDAIPVDKRVGAVWTGMQGEKGRSESGAHDAALIDKR